MHSVDLKSFAFGSLEHVMKLEWLLNDHNQQEIFVTNRTLSLLEPVFHSFNASTKPGMYACIIYLLSGN